MGRSIFEKLGLVEANELKEVSEATMEGGLQSWQHNEPLVFDSADIANIDPPYINIESDVIDIDEVYEASKIHMDSIPSVTVCTIRDMLDSLPNEMPQKTKKTTLKNLMNSLGYDPAQIKKDAEFRKAVLDHANQKKTIELQTELDDNVKKIEELKVEIEQLSIRNNDIMSAIETNRANIDDAVSFVDYTMAFIEGD